MSKQEAFDRLLDAALLLFAQNGLHATPTSKISKAAGVSTGLLFHHFPNKDALIEALYVREKVNWYEQVLTDEVAQLNFESKFYRVISESLRWMQQHPESVRFIMQIHPTAYRQRTEQHPALLPYKQNVFETFTVAQKEQLLVNLPPFLIEELIFYQLVATLEYANHHPEYELDESAEAQVAQLIWKQLKAS